MSAVENWKAKHMATTELTVNEAESPSAIHQQGVTVVGLNAQVIKAKAEGQEARAANAPAELQEIISGVCARFNPTHFVAPEGSNVYVWNKHFDPVLKRLYWRKLSFSAFTDLYRNDVLQMPYPSGYKPLSVAKIWLDASSRPTYPGGMWCIPLGPTPEGVFNIYTGWGVTAKDGVPTLLLDFILKVVCSGNKALAKYLIQWLGFCVQNPDMPPGVAVVLVGGKGVGKSTLGRLMVKIHGAHGMHISNTKFLVGSFNAHLRNVLFLFCDEAWWAGDKAGEGVLKAGVTETTITIEAKGVDAVTAPNMMSIMMATNNEHAVPSSGDERRWFVLRVSSARQNDHPYWDELNHYIDNGGAEEFLHYLQHIDLTKFNVRSVPNTAELANQKIHSFGALADFIFQELSEGRLCGSDWGDDSAPFCLLFMTHLEEFCQRHPRHRYNVPTPQYVGRHLSEMVGAVKGRNSNGKRDYTYRFPPLEVARGNFAAWAKLGSDYQWEDA